MTLRRIGLRAFRLPLVRALRTAHGEIARRKGWLLRLEHVDGRVGLGEATPLPQFGTESHAECEIALRNSARSLSSRGRGFERMAESGDIARYCVAAPCARAAFDTAIADMVAQQRSKSLAAHWRCEAGLAGDPCHQVSVQAWVTGDTPEEVSCSAAHARKEGFGAFKLKLGVSNRSFEFDIVRVVALREAVGPAARIRLDANEAWARDEALRALERLADFGIDYVEQPVERTDLEGLAFLDREAPTRVAADEALLGEGLARCLEIRAARILIVKPAAIGGLRVALDLAEHAKTTGLRVVWSSLLDGAVSRQAALQLASAFESGSEVHGLGTGPLLADDFDGALPVRGGTIQLSSDPGLGLAESLRSRDAFEAENALWTAAPQVWEVAR